MNLIARRAFLLASASLPFVGAPAAHAADPLPDARFVGFAQAVNDFEIGASRLALSKSMNENVRGHASRMLAEHTEAAEELRKARAEAGVSYAPDPSQPPNTTAMLQRLSALEGADFDIAYANAQLALQTEAEVQYGAYAQSGQGGALRRYAQRQLPKVKAHLEYSRLLAGGR